MTGNKIPNSPVFFFFFFFIKKNAFLLKPIKNDINQAHTKGLEIRQNYTQTQNQSLKTVHLEKRKRMTFSAIPNCLPPFKIHWP